MKAWYWKQIPVFHLLFISKTKRWYSCRDLIFLHSSQLRLFLRFPISFLSLIMKLINRISQSLLLQKQRIALFAKAVLLKLMWNQVSQKPSYTAQDKFPKCSFREAWQFWPGKTLQQEQTINLEQAALFCTFFMCFYFSLSWFFGPQVFTAHAIGSCMKEDFPTSLFCLLCRNLSRPF